MDKICRGTANERRDCDRWKEDEKKNNCTKTASYQFHFLHFDKNLGGKIITQGT